MGQQHERWILRQKQDLATRQRQLQVSESCRSKEGILFPLRGVQVHVVSEEAASDRERELGGGRDRWKGSERETETRKRHRDSYGKFLQKSCHYQHVHATSTCRSRRLREQRHRLQS